MPEKKIFRSSINFLMLIIGKILLFFIIYYFFIHTTEYSVNLLIWLLVIIVPTFGYLIKFLLSFIFPEVVLYKSGIKFIGRKQILWKDLSKITFDFSKDTKIILFKNNGCIISETVNINSEFYLKRFIKSYYKEYNN